MMNERSRNRGIFASTTLRLTGWYVLLLMLLSVLFSVVLYAVATNEFSRALGPGQPGDVRVFLDDDTARSARQRRVAVGSQRLVVSLVLFNLGVLVGGTALSYFLARRTLHPIEEAHNAQARFASDAAHELRTPLAVMQAEMEVQLRQKKTTVQEYETIVRSSLEEVSRLRTLADRLLLLASQHELPKEIVDTEAVAVEALNRVLPLAQARNMSIDNAVARSSVAAHYESVADILTILLDNAIKYAPAGTHIVVQSVTHDHAVELAVKDQGPGIAAEEQGKIFDRFYRADTARSKENVEGHGLGLSLAKRLAEEMDASLRVVSDPGKGATFILRLKRHGV